MERCGTINFKISYYASTVSSVIIFTAISVIDDGSTAVFVE